TTADSLAHRMVEAHGGLSAWAGVRYLRFDFGFESPERSGLTARHLWDRQTGDYRLEWFPGTDTTAVALFNVNTREGKVFVNGEQAAQGVSEMLDSAYRRYINDTYWLLAPLKVFDDGVRRTMATDSASGEHVLALSFADVGLTPGDRYWLTVDSETGMLRRWSFMLEGWENRPASTYDWVGYRTMPVPGGEIKLAERKARPDGSRSTMTNNLALPETVPPNVFIDASVAMN
ncbi:MAG: hypothetical protein R3282_10790, partial [Rhodothermales bacterium]|nr:hypothetical protein [Rhodothermales bacterium]